jgi:hypothetical protein
LAPRRGLGPGRAARVGRRARDEEVVNEFGVSPAATNHGYAESLTVARKASLSPSRQVIYNVLKHSAAGIVDVHMSRGEGLPVQLRPVCLRPHTNWRPCSLVG